MERGRLEKWRDREILYIINGLQASCTGFLTRSSFRNDIVEMQFYVR